MNVHTENIKKREGSSAASLSFFYNEKLYELVVFFLDLKIALRVTTDWADARSFFADYNVSAIDALPDCIAVT